MQALDWAAKTGAHDATGSVAGRVAFTMSAQSTPLPVQAAAVVLPNGNPADVYVPLLADSARPALKRAFPLVVVLQGARVDKARYSEFGQRLAAHGYAVVIPNHEQEVPGFGRALFTEGRVINAALAWARRAVTDERSPCWTVVDVERLAVVGHSFGGGIAIDAAAGLCVFPADCQASFVRPAALKAVVVYGGNRPELIGDTHGVAILLLQGTLDSVATLEKAQQTLPRLQPPYALISIAGANHYGLCNADDPTADPHTPTLDQARGLDQIVSWTHLWLQVHLASGR